MHNILQHIARENFRSSGYITHPGRERRTSWSFTSPPQSPFFKTDSVRCALMRRERAATRLHAKPPFKLRQLFDALLRR